MLAYITLFGPNANVDDQDTELCERKPIMLVMNKNIITNENSVILKCRDENPNVCYIGIYTEAEGGDLVAIMELVEPSNGDRIVKICENVFEFQPGGGHAERIFCEN